MSVKTAMAGIGGVFALCMAGAIAAILSAAPAVNAEDMARVGKLPGGFEPLPEFETTSRELEFRGAECAFGTGPRYTLVRTCRSGFEPK